jgi:hypothetical protein
MSIKSEKLPNLSQNKGADLICQRSWIDQVVRICLQLQARGFNPRIVSYSRSISKLCDMLDQTNIEWLTHYSWTEIDPSTRSSTDIHARNALP